MFSIDVKGTHVKGTIDTRRKSEEGKADIKSKEQQLCRVKQKCHPLPGSDYSAKTFPPREKLRSRNGMAVPERGISKRDGTAISASNH